MTPSGSTVRFWAIVSGITGAYVFFVVAMLVSASAYTTPLEIVSALGKPEILFSIKLSLITCLISSVCAVVVAVPTGYLLSRGHFAGKAWADLIVDIPIILPPMVLGLCLLIFFQTSLGRALNSIIAFQYQVAGVVLAQFLIGAAFAIRTMRGTFDHLSPRPENVAMTLGATRGQAFRLVALPAAKRGVFAALCIAWARSMGEFGPILVFAGATRMRTEVLPTTVWLELSVGNLEAAVAVSLLMIGLSFSVLGAVRLAGERL
jgi:molybdate transport system permease protein